jgi:branched-chain amino acid transport system ATP-binding protein
MTDPIIETDGLTKQFGGLAAVDDVSFSIDEAEGITALIGPNGAGKTTLYNLITGHIAPSEGRITFQGEDITGLSTRQRVKQGLGRSFQQTNIFTDLTVRQNLRGPVIARSDARYNPLDRIDGREELNAEVDELLDLVGLREDADVSCSELSYGDRRRVEIGIALATDPAFILLDEPTAGTAPSETQEVIRLIRDLREETEISFLIVEHDMNVVFSIASRILVLHQGQLLADGTPEEIQENEQVQTAYLGDHGSQEGDTPASLVDRSKSGDRPARNATDEPLLSVDSIHTFYGDSHVLNDVSMDVHSGEIVALLGRNGAGKTTTLRSIIGLTPPREGSITYDGERIDGRPPHQISRLGVGFVPQERNVFSPLSVEDNLQTILDEDSEWPLERVYELFPRLDERRKQRAGSLSGGEKQMLVIARALVTAADLLVLDEPSEGLAPVIIDDLEDILRDLADEDMTVLLTEQNLPFAASLADYSYIINKGTIEWSGPMEELLENESVINRYLALSEVGVE